MLFYEKIKALKIKYMRNISSLVCFKGLLFTSKTLFICPFEALEKLPFNYS